MGGGPRGPPSYSARATEELCEWGLKQSGTALGSVRRREKAPGRSEGSLLWSLARFGPRDGKLSPIASGRGGVRGAKRPRRETSPTPRDTFSGAFCTLSAPAGAASSPGPLAETLASSSSAVSCVPFGSSFTSSPQLSTEGHLSPVHMGSHALFNVA